jgi:hypothetical protein
MTDARKGYLLVEGHGEVQAAGNLITRLSADIRLPVQWTNPIRWKNLHQRDGVVRGASFIRSKPDVGALLVLRDEDDGCPRDLGPIAAGWLRELDLPFPSAVVLLHPEYEVLFLPCLERMRGQPLDGRPGLTANTAWDGASWEARRGLKEWLTKSFPPNRSYKPTLDQLPMTRMIDFAVLRAAKVSCFQTLERALTFLARPPDTVGVYPL